MLVKWFDRDTLLWVVPNYITETAIVLDIGCGIRPQEFFKPEVHICCEPCDEYVRVLQNKYAKSPNIRILQSTGIEAVKSFPDKSVDSVFMLDLIEHLDKDEGKLLISECERIARIQVVIFTPLGFLPQEYYIGEEDAWGLHGGAWQAHKSGWSPDDFDDSWTILGSKEFHLADSKGKTLDPRAGAFWAIKNLAPRFSEMDNAKLQLVSIITPAYNRASYLDETIQSVLSQDYPRIEYIVLDDGSTDNTREVLEKYTGRLIWESHPNMGESRTVNKGFSMAHGEIVAVVNSDDPLLSGAVSEAVAFMQAHPDILVAYPDWNMIDPDSKFIEHVEVPNYDYLYMVRNHHCIVGPGAFIQRKAFEMTEMRDPEFKYVGDFEYWLRLGLYGKFARIAKTLATWRVHPNAATVSQKSTAMADEHIRLMQKFYSRRGLPIEVRKARAEAYSWAYYIAAISVGASRRLAFKYYFKSVSCHPRSYLNSVSSLTRLGTVIAVTLPKPLSTLLVRLYHLVRPILARGYRLYKHTLRRDKAKAANLF